MKNFFGTSVNVGKLWVALVIVFLLPLAAFSATNPQVSAGQAVTAGLKSDGTVLSIIGRLATGNTSAWAGITQISAAPCHIVGLKADGTCVATGNNYYGQCNVSGWTNIVQVVASYSRTIGLRSDGTLVIVGGNLGYGQTAALNWTGIKQISAGLYHIVGLKADGTVVYAGYSTNLSNVSSWSGITQISAGGDHTVGLKADGTVVACGSNDYGENNVGSWTGITQISAGDSSTIGLKSDGTCVAVGGNTGNCAGQINVQTWTDLVQVSAGMGYTVGLKSDGTCVASGYNYWNQFTGIELWNLGATVVAVPNVITLSDTVAETTINNAQLLVGAWNSNYSSSPVNTVISQNPVAGTKVKKGSPVTLTVSLGAAPAPAPTYEATATLKILNQKTKLPIAGVVVTTRDKDGKVLQVLTTDIYGVVILKMPKAGKVWIYEVKAGFTPVLYPDVQVINKGAKNSIVSYMTPAATVTATAKKK